MKKPNTSRIELYAIDTVRALREKNNVSQQQLADYLGMSKGFVGNVESNKYRAKYNLNHLNAIAKFFNCSPQDFLPDRPI